MKGTEVGTPGSSSLGGVIWRLAFDFHEMSCVAAIFSRTIIVCHKFDITLEPSCTLGIPLWENFTGPSISLVDLFYNKVM